MTNNNFGSGPCEPIKYTEEMKMMIIEAKPAPATACEIFTKALITQLKTWVISDKHYTYNRGSDWGDVIEHTTAWYDSDNARNSISYWEDDGDGIWSKAKGGKSTDEFEFNVLTDNHEDIINRILGGN